jgi:hypothetical protein
MNLKVSNLVAIQFGVFVGIMFWLAYSQLPFAGPRAATKTPEPKAEPAANVAPAFKPGEQRSQTLDYRADGEEAEPAGEQPVPLLHEYSPAAVQQHSALAAQLYYQQITPRRYASARVENGPIVADAPSYAVVEQAPAVAPAEYMAEPETVAYAEPAQVVVYSQPQFVVFSNRHRFANRCRAASDPRGARTTFAHQRRDRGRPHLTGSTEFESPASPSAALRRPGNSLGVIHRRNDSAPSCQETQGFKPQGRR